MTAEQDTRTGIRGALRRLGRIFRAMISIPVQVIAQRDVLSVIREETRRLGAAAVESAAYAEAELRRVDDRLERVERELAELRGVLEGQPGAAESESLERRGEIARPPSG